MNRAVLSSDRMDWATPRSFFAELDREFGFTLDACATAENAVVPQFLSPADDALTVPWNGVVWMNPPFGYAIREWVRKAYRESRAHADKVVCLIPSRTDTSWWHEYVCKASEIRFIKGRLRFSGHGVNAPFPCAIVVFDRRHFGGPVYSTMNRILDGKAPS